MSSTGISPFPYGGVFSLFPLAIITNHTVVNNFVCMLFSTLFSFLGIGSNKCDLGGKYICWILIDLILSDHCSCSYFHQQCLRVPYLWDSHQVKISFKMQILLERCLAAVKITMPTIYTIFLQFTKCFLSYTSSHPTTIKVLLDDFCRNKISELECEAICPRQDD